MLWLLGINLNSLCYLFLGTGCFNCISFGVIRKVNSCLQETRNRVFFRCTCRNKRSIYLIPWLPGHDPRLQLRVSIREPLHSRPPKAGRGLEQERNLLCVPTPQDDVHMLQSAQALHSPSTVRNRAKLPYIKYLSNGEVAK